MNIDRFGTSYVVDRRTGLVILAAISNRVAKFISGSLLDTFVSQLSPSLEPESLRNWEKSGAWIQIKNGVISAPSQPISQGLLDARRVANMRRRGYLFLMEQATILGASYDSLADLQADDLPMCHLDKEKYVRTYADAIGVSILEAEKQLEFMIDNLLMIHLKKQSLIWKYSKRLRQAMTQSEFDAIRNDILAETIGIGQV